MSQLEVACFFPTMSSSPFPNLFDEVEQERWFWWQWQWSQLRVFDLSLGLIGTLVGLDEWMDGW